MIPPAPRSDLSAQIRAKEQLTSPTPNGTTMAQLVQRARAAQNATRMAMLREEKLKEYRTSQPIQGYGPGALLPTGQRSGGDPFSPRFGPA